MACATKPTAEASNAGNWSSSNRALSRSAFAFSIARVISARSSVVLMLRHSLVDPTQDVVADENAGRGGLRSGAAE